MIKAGVVLSAALLWLGGSSGCAYTSYKNLNARSVTSPIEPESARMSALFCSEYAAEQSRREHNYRSISDTGFVVGAVGLGTALGTGLATFPVKSESADRALDIVALSSVALWATAWSLWLVHDSRANTAATEAGLVGQRAVQIHQQAEEVAALQAEIKQAKEELAQAQEALNDDAKAGSALPDARQAKAEAKTRLDELVKDLAARQSRLATASSRCFRVDAPLDEAQHAAAQQQPSSPTKQEPTQPGSQEQAHAQPK